MTISQTILVTDFANIPASPQEMAESGAVFTSAGRPRNLNAKVLMDLAGHLGFEEWAGRNALRVEVRGE